MCLVAKNNHCFRYAKKDIVCYKVLRVIYQNVFNHIEFLHYVTPFRLITIPDNVINGNVPYVALGKCATLRDLDECLIDRGYVHTFAEYPQAWMANHPVGHAVFKCIIPKGTRYAKGIFADGFVSYASKKIVFVEKVEQ